MSISQANQFHGQESGPCPHRHPDLPERGGETNWEHIKRLRAEREAQKEQAKPPEQGATSDTPLQNLNPHLAKQTTTSMRHRLLAGVNINTLACYSIRCIPRKTTHFFRLGFEETGTGTEGNTDDFTTNTEVIAAANFASNLPGISGSVPDSSPALAPVSIEGGRSRVGATAWPVTCQFQPVTRFTVSRCSDRTSMCFGVSDKLSTFVMGRIRSLPDVRSAVAG